MPCAPSYGGYEIETDLWAYIPVSTCKLLRKIRLYKDLTNIGIRGMEA